MLRNVTSQLARRARSARAMSTMNDNINAARFDDHALKASVDEATYQAFHAALADGAPMDKKAANAVAEGIHAWAVERGATQFAHWFR